MVHYELAVIFRALGKSDLPLAVRRACSTLLDQGSVVRSMENRGERRLPYRMGAHKERFSHGRSEFVVLTHKHMTPLPIIRNCSYSQAMTPLVNDVMTAHLQIKSTIYQLISSHDNIGIYLHVNHSLDHYKFT